MFSWRGKDEGWSPPRRKVILFVLGLLAIAIAIVFGIEAGLIYLIWVAFFGTPTLVGVLLIAALSVAVELALATIVATIIVISKRLAGQQ